MGLRRSADCLAGARAAAVVLLSLIGGACATVLGSMRVGVADARSDDTSTECDSAGDVRPLVRWDEITGNLLLRPLAGPQAGQGRVVRLVSPVAVAARGSRIHIADAGSRQLLTYDVGARVLRAVSELPGLHPDTRLDVDRALSLYVTMPTAARVLVFDMDGRRLRELGATAMLGRPVAAVVNPASGDVFVADGLAARVLTFNAAGTLGDVFAADPGAAPFASIVDLAYAPDQLFALDATGHRVHLLSQTGLYRYAFGVDDLLEPAAIAVDDYNRVYVADNGDRTIKVFRGGERVAVLGLRGSPVSLQRVTDLWHDQDLLYVADPSSASVKIFRVVRPCD